MHKWPLLSLIGLSFAGFYGLALASDADTILPTNDTHGCSALIQQGDVNPPVPTNDLNTLKTCLASCDLLYKSLGEQGRTEDMLRGSAYCRQSLNNLYFSSVAEIINDQLDQQTQQQQAMQQQAFLDKISATIKQKQQNQSQPAPTAVDTAEPGHLDTAPTHSNPQQLIGPPDNVNW